VFFSLTHILQLISIVFLVLNKINLIVIIFDKKRQQSDTISIAMIENW
jgi:hypothetical protein